MTTSTPNLTAIALAGVAASPEGALMSGATVDTLPLPGADRGHDLLLRAGAAAIYRLAGLAPRSDITAPEIAPEETLPLCPPETAALIGTLLPDGNMDDLLPEAFARMARAGVILPPKLVPLALHSVPYAARSLLLPLIGQRGRWVARHNPRWSWAAVSAGEAVALPSDAETIWQEGKSEQRSAILAALRAHDPAKAREWLSASWKKEGVKLRETMLASFWQGLGPEDEPFLESVLDTPGDRAESARVTAAQMLATLPNSALAERLRARADAALTFDGTTLDAKPPTKLDDRWTRDSGEPPGSGAVEDSKKKGQRAAWLMQIIDRVPPSHWTERFGTSPLDLITASAESQWRVNILQGLTNATDRFQDRVWAAALWDAWLALPEKVVAQTGDNVSSLLKLLAPLLEPDALEAFILNLLANPTRYTGLALWEALQWLPTPWNDVIGSAYLQHLREFVAMLKPESRDAKPWDDTLGYATQALPETLFAAAHKPLTVSELQDEMQTRSHWAMSRFNAMLSNFAEKIQMRERIKKVIES